RRFRLGSLFGSFFRGRLGLLGLRFFLLFNLESLGFWNLERLHQLLDNLSLAQPFGLSRDNTLCRQVGSGKIQTSNVLNNSNRDSPAARGAVTPGHRVWVEIAGQIEERAQQQAVGGKGID